jgi:hypothetical protein
MSSIPYQGFEAPVGYVQHPETYIESLRGECKGHEDETKKECGRNLYGWADAGWDTTIGRCSIGIVARENMDSELSDS